MPKVTDTQHVILSTAARRDDRAVLPVSDSLKVKGAALTKTLQGLMRNGLIEEKPATAKAAMWPETDGGRHTMLVVTNPGIHAIDSKTEPASSHKRPSRPCPGRTTKTTTSKTGRRSPGARQATKQALLIDLLKRKRGATIHEIIAATNWQPHSVRGTISGTLKKKLSLTVTSEKEEKRGRVYRITQKS